MSDTREWQRIARGPHLLLLALHLLGALLLVLALLLGAEWVCEDAGADDDNVAQGLVVRVDGRLGDLAQHIGAADEAPEDAVLAVEVRRRLVRDEELRPVGAGALRRLNK